MVAPGLLAVLFPIAVGLVLKAEAAAALAPKVLETYLRVKERGLL